MRSAWLGVVFLLMPISAFAQRAKTPADAAVFIRIVGSAHADIENFGARQSVDLDHVEIGTGSGFVISPLGYVITNNHLVADAEPILVTRIKGFQEAKVTLKTSRIDVCFQPQAIASFGLASACTSASVAASDPTLDLAVLFISGSNLPYIALGDSNAVTSGLPVDALGYPLGRDVEVGRATSVSDLVPGISITPGAVSALRANDAGERRYLQITNSVNPGNSGGPLVDREGFAVGVIRMRLTRAPDIAFAIPINEVKDFLESNGLDQVLPSRRLRLGPLQNLEAKGMALRFPEPLVDTSPFHSHVETVAEGLGISLRIDRVLSPWRPQQLEGALIAGTAFEPFSVTPRQARVPPRPVEPAMLLGGTTGMDGDAGREIRMDYAVLDLGREKLVARYVGLAEPMAFNESVLRESLSSLQAQLFAQDDRVAVERLEWSRLSGRGVPVPVGWSTEPGRPSTCAGLPQPTAFTAAFPGHDSTLVLRAATWSQGAIAPEAAAPACSPRRGSVDGASYTLRGEWLGVAYVVEGVFVRSGSNQVVQLEVLATEQRATLARALLAAWVRKSSE